MVDISDNLIPVKLVLEIKNLIQRNIDKDEEKQIPQYKRDKKKLQSIDFKDNINKIKQKFKNYRARMESEKRGFWFEKEEHHKEEHVAEDEHKILNDEVQ